MTLEELRELRGKVIENRERLVILNHQYNVMLEEKHNPKKRDNKKDEEIIKKSKAYKIMSFLRTILPLGVGCLFALGIVPFMVLFLYIILSPFVGATFEVLILPKIVFGKDYKVLKGSKTQDFDQSAADELYSQVSEVREEYHRLRHQFEDQIALMGLENSDEYKEYLKIVDKVIENIESASVSPSSDKALGEVKEFNLQQ